MQKSQRERSQIFKITFSNSAAPTAKRSGAQTTEPCAVQTHNERSRYNRINY